MMMTKIESDQWACRRRTWFRFRWRPGGKIRGFPWWAKHRWRGVRAEGGDAGLRGGVHRYLTMSCTRCYVPEEIHITNLAEFLFVADVKLPREVQLQLGLMPPELKTPFWRRLLTAGARFVRRSQRPLAKLARAAWLITLSPMWIPMRLYKDWHYRRLSYLEGLAALRVNREYAREDQNHVIDRVGVIDGEVGDLQTRVSELELTAHDHRDAPIIEIPAPDPTLKESLQHLGRKSEEHDERVEELERQVEELENRPPGDAYEVPKCQAEWCEKPEFCGICHRCADCSSSVPLDPFTGLHNHNIQSEGPDRTFGGQTF